jgi:hypothetical protein
LWPCAVAVIDGGGPGVGAGVVKDAGAIEGSILANRGVAASVDEGSDVVDMNRADVLREESILIEDAGGDGAIGRAIGEKAGRDGGAGVGNVIQLEDAVVVEIVAVGKAGGLVLRGEVGGVEEENRASGAFIDGGGAAKACGGGKSTLI